MPISLISLVRCFPSHRTHSHPHPVCMHAQSSRVPIPTYITGYKIGNQSLSSSPPALPSSECLTHNRPLSTSQLNLPKTMPSKPQIPISSTIFQKRFHPSCTLSDDSQSLLQSLPQTQASSIILQNTAFESRAVQSTSPLSLAVLVVVSDMSVYAPRRSNFVPQVTYFPVSLMRRRWQGAVRCNI